MTIKVRRVLFYGLFFLFIITGLITVFYSYGWRINAGNCSIAKLSNCLQKTGGLFIETKPKGVVIKIDDKIFKDKSGLIQNGTLISNLLPKIYKIKIEKENYLPYEKNVKVESNLVAEIPNIILIPEKLSAKGASLPNGQGSALDGEKTLIPISKPIDNFWINSQQKIVFKSNEILYYRQSFGPFKLKGSEFVGFSEDGEKIIVSALTKKSRIYYLYDLNDLSKSINLSAVFKNAVSAVSDTKEIAKIIFHPANSNKLIISAKDGDENNYLYLLDLNRLKLEIIIKEPIFTWTIKNPNIYYIKIQTDADLTQTNVDNIYIKKTKTQNLKPKTYSLFSYNLILKTESVISQFPNFPIFQFLNSPIILSPDNKKIAFFDNGGEISIYFLEDYRSGINKKAGDIINLNLYTGKTVKNISWHKDSYHLLVKYGENVDFIEIDDRTPINKYALIEKAADFYYDFKNNRIYFLKDKALYYFDYDLG